MDTVSLLRTDRNRWRWHITIDAADGGRRTIAFGVASYNKPESAQQALLMAYDAAVVRQAFDYVETKRGHRWRLKLADGKVSSFGAASWPTQAKASIDAQNSKHTQHLSLIHI